MLTPTQEDYIESIFRRQQGQSEGVRVAQLAEDLGCRMPTVTRTVQQLVEKGMVDHEARGLIKLTDRGEAIAEDLTHRHGDVEAFLELLLGLPHEQAEIDACRLEHSLSKLATQRLHALMNYVEALPVAERNRLRETVKRGSEQEVTFPHLVEVKIHGWRG